MANNRYLSLGQGLGIVVTLEDIEVEEIPSSENITQKHFLASIEYDEWNLGDLMTFMHDTYGYTVIDINLNTNPKYGKSITFKRLKETVYDKDLPIELTLKPKYINVFSVN